MTVARNTRCRRRGCTRPVAFVREVSPGASDGGYRYCEPHFRQFIAGASAGDHRVERQMLREYKRVEKVPTEGRAQ
jgi:hypothetical protein